MPIVIRSLNKSYITNIANSYT